VRRRSRGTLPGAPARRQASAPVRFAGGALRRSGNEDVGATPPSLSRSSNERGGSGEQPGSRLEPACSRIAGSSPQWRAPLLDRTGRNPCPSPRTPAPCRPRSSPRS
jgi:hypothetical protein